MKTTLFISSLMILLFWQACTNANADGNKEVIVISDEAKTRFNQQLATLGTFKQAAELNEPLDLKQTKTERDPSNALLECYEKRYKVAPGFDEMLTLDPTTDVIYPGAILVGASIPSGEYTPVVADRQAITLSISLQNLSGSPIVEIANPKLSTVREGIKTILAQEVESATPAKLSFEISEVYSEEHLGVALGANYRSAGGSVSAAFNFNQSTYKNKFLVKYIQTYYTIDMDVPAQPSDLFATLPDWSSFGNTSPVLVSSIAYGRMVLYAVETNKSLTEVNAAFNAAVKSGGAALKAKYQKTIEASNIKAVVIGGSANDAAQIVHGPNELYSFIAEGGNYSKASPGAPLSYKLRYVKQGTPTARVVLTSEYTIRECDVAYPKYRITLNKLKCVDCPEVGDPEIFGRITGAAYMNGKRVGKVAEWSKSRRKAWEIHKKQQYGLKRSADVELYRPNYKADYIKIEGWIKERDKGDDDDFGTDARTVYLKDIKLDATTSGTLKFNGHVDVSYKIERLE